MWNRAPNTTSIPDQQYHEKILSYFALNFDNFPYVHARMAKAVARRKNPFKVKKLLELNRVT